MKIPRLILNVYGFSHVEPRAASAPTLSGKRCWHPRPRPGGNCAAGHQGQRRHTSLDSEQRWLTRRVGKRRLPAVTEEW